MGRFHDELIKARRDGTAPGMEDTLPSVEDPGPTFLEFTGAGIVSCSRCGALVEAPRAPQHADWHRRLGD